MSDTKNDFVYEQNAKILCFHGPLIYEARVLDQRLEHDDPEVKGPLYRVHYLGWSKRWDEWVDKTRVLEINEENLALQKRISDMYAMKKPTKKTTPASTLTSATTTASTTSRKRPREEEEIEKDKRDYLNKPEIRLDIPSSLKCQLVDDWENVTKNQQLVPLPRDPSISQILAQYKKYNLEKKKDINTELIDEVLHGLSMYFNKAIGSMLLYQFERQQYSEIRKKHSNKDMTEIYGAEHLLRLYVQLPQLIAHTSMDELTISVLSEYLFDVLKYLQKMQKQLFISEYQNATPSYVSLVNGN